MAKKVTIIGVQPRRVRIVDRSRSRVDPADLAAKLGAEPAAIHLGRNLNPTSLAELGSRLLGRLRSTGGRPALDDATEICRVPLSADDLKALEGITSQVEQRTGTKPSPGQLASVIVREYLMEHAASSEDASESRKSG